MPLGSTLFRARVGGQKVCWAWALGNRDREEVWMFRVMRFMTMLMASREKWKSSSGEPLPFFYFMGVKY